MITLMCYNPNVTLALMTLAATVLTLKIMCTPLYK